MTYKYIITFPDGDKLEFFTKDKIDHLIRDGYDLECVDVVYDDEVKE